ncbi:hypothetical protein D3C72_1011960 [compost metagenome]
MPVFAAVFSVSDKLYDNVQEKTTLPSGPNQETNLEGISLVPPYLGRAGPDHPGRRRPCRRRLAGRQADHPGGAVRGGRHVRHPGPDGRAGTGRQPEPDRAGGNQGRGGRRAGRRRGGARQAGRLHAAAGHHCHARDQPGAVARHQLQRRPRLCAGDLAGQHLERAAGGREPALQDGARRGGGGQGQPGHHRFWVGGPGHVAASVGRSVQAIDRRASHARAVPRQRASHPGPDRRPDSQLV